MKTAINFFSLVALLSCAAVVCARQAADVTLNFTRD
jgi:hypothetical protein